MFANAEKYKRFNWIASTLQNLTRNFQIISLQELFAEEIRCVPQVLLQLMLSRPNLEEPQEVQDEHFRINKCQQTILKFYKL